MNLLNLIFLHLKFQNFLNNKKTLNMIFKYDFNSKFVDNFLLLKLILILIFYSLLQYSLIKSLSVMKYLLMIIIHSNQSLVNFSYLSFPFLFNHNLSKNQIILDFIISILLSQQFLIQSQHQLIWNFKKSKFMVKFLLLFSNHSCFYFLYYSTLNLILIIFFFFLMNRFSFFF